MRILAITNLYPPHVIGGYEIGCRDVLEALRARGHEVTVLTSTHGVAAPTVEGHVHRRLVFQEDFGGTLRYLARLCQTEVANARVLRELCEKSDPEVIYCWNLTRLSRRVLWSAQMRPPLAHYVFDHGVTAWVEGDPWYHYWHTRPSGARAVLKSAARLPVRLAGLATDYCPPDCVRYQFASAFLRAQAARQWPAVADAPVIPFGLNLAAFPFQAAAPDPHRLLFVGQLAPHKGVALALEALAVLVHRLAHPEVTCTFAGGWLNREYQGEITGLVERLGLARHVHFTGQLPREQLPRLYHEHDVLVFPSVWDEPYGISMLEAMACGLAVVTTGTGGNGEIIEPGVSGLVGPKDNPAVFAAALQDALAPDRRQSLGTAARQRVEQHYRLERTIDRIEQDLLALL